MADITALALCAFTAVLIPAQRAASICPMYALKNRLRFTEWRRALRFKRPLSGMDPIRQSVCGRGGFAQCPDSSFPLTTTPFSFQPKPALTTAGQ